MKRRFLQILIAALLVVTGEVEAREYRILVRSQDLIVSHPESGLSVFAITVSEVLRTQRIDYATIEFYLEPCAAEDAGHPYSLGAAPAQGGSPTDTTWAVPEGEWPLHVGVTRETSEYVKMDVTSVVKQWAARLEPCYMIVYRGSETSGGVDTSLRTGSLGEGVVARIRVLTVKR